jgi:hypothetical protein
VTRRLPRQPPPLAQVARRRREAALAATHKSERTRSRRPFLMLFKDYPSLKWGSCTLAEGSSVLSRARPSAPWASFAATAPREHARRRRRRSRREPRTSIAFGECKTARLFSEAQLTCRTRNVAQASSVKTRHDRDSRVCTAAAIVPIQHLTEAILCLQERVLASFPRCSSRTGPVGPWASYAATASREHARRHGALPHLDRSVRSGSPCGFSTRVCSVLSFEFCVEVEFWRSSVASRASFKFRARATSSVEF